MQHLRAHPTPDKITVLLIFFFSEGWENDTQKMFEMSTYTKIIKVVKCRYVLVASGLLMQV